MRLELLPLGDDAVAALVADAVGGEPDQTLLELASRAAGNPSLITELVAGFIDEHAITVQAGRARLSTDVCLGGCRLQSTAVSTSSAAARGNWLRQPPSSGGRSG